MATNRSKNPKAVEVVANGVIALHTGLDAHKAVSIAKVALNPPQWVTNDDHWLDVVVRGKHSTYPGATQHYKASCRKHSIPEVNVVGVTKNLQMQLAEVL